MNYHIDDWRAQQRAQSDHTQSPWEVRQRRRCIILQPWLRGRLHATNTLPHTTVFVSTHNPASRLLQPRINVGMMLDSRCVRQQKSSWPNALKRALNSCVIATILLWLLTLCPCSQHGKGGIAPLYWGTVFLTWPALVGLVTGRWTVVSCSNWPVTKIDNGQVCCTVGLSLLERRC